MTFDKFFKIISYAVALCGLFSLYASGGVGILVSAAFVFVTALAWSIEDTRWQLSEKLGIVFVFLFIPLFYLDWKYQISGFASRETAAAGSLARLILVLAAIKLLQKKGDRDWIFIYLISFFEILLAAGLSISPLFVLSLILYLLFVVCAIVAFEIRKASNKVQAKKVRKENYLELNRKTLFRLPVTAVGLLIIVTLIAVPLFFSLPRVGGAGFGKNSSSTTTGFSDSIRLGEIARVQQNNEIVMRVRLEPDNREKVRNIKWRGVALDTFDNRGWRRSNPTTEPFIKTEKDFFLVDGATDATNLVTQTVYLEPLDTPVLFSLARPVAFQGGFQVINKDAEGAITVSRGGGERFSYKVISDVTQPSVEKLKADSNQYSASLRRYLDLPRSTDGRIADLARDIVQRSGAVSRYDKARAVETYLQNNFGYTLDLKAGGEQPLADFLFNVREGHCEYFATAMAVMLRTQGIATRVVNGFQSGEYNETADAYVVRQREAHAWVEVYFPKENAWIAFDPTPAAGQFSQYSDSSGFFGRFNDYIEALETFWIQYVVSYDNQEQKSLVRSFRNSLQDYQIQASTWANLLQLRLSDWWKDVRGDKGFAQSAQAVGWGVLYLAGIGCGILLIVWLYRRFAGMKLWTKIRDYFSREHNRSIVEFYERMQRTLARKGFERPAHQTPLEFAFALGMPEAVKITEKYNRVRFGEKNLSGDEAEEIENWLERLEANSVRKDTEKN